MTKGARDARAFWRFGLGPELTALAAAVAPRAHRLEGDADMGFAIGLAGDGRQAAEPEILGRGVADRPFAGALGQFHQRQPLGALFNLAHRSQRLGADFIGGGLRRQGLACRDDRLAHRDRQGGDAGRARQRRGAAGRGSGALRARGRLARGGASAATGFGAGSGRGGAAAGGGATSGSSPSTAPPPTRLDRPRRCTLPITALRVTPPSSLAIWLADWPSAHIFLSVSTRSSVQDMANSGSGGEGSPEGARCAADPILILSAGDTRRARQYQAAA